MPQSDPAAPYATALAALFAAAQEQNVPAEELRRVLDMALAARGWQPQTLSSDDLQALLFPELDTAYSALLAEEPRQRMLRRIAEQLAAQELGAFFSPDAEEAQSSLADISDAPLAASAPAAPPAAAEQDGDDEDWDFGEDEFEFEDPEYLAAQSVRRHDLAQEAEQGRLIADLGHITGVHSVLVCRQNGEVLQSRSLGDTAGLGSVVAAAVLLLRGRGLRLMSAQLSDTVLVLRPLGDHVVAVLAQPSVNIGRLLSELSGLEPEARS